MSQNVKMLYYVNISYVTV